MSYVHHTMAEPRPERDPRKDRANQRKHGVGFAEAATVFPDEHAKREQLHYTETVAGMKKEYDFSTARRNPYATRLKKPVTIRLDEATIGYFKDLAEETGIPYQTLINLYLRDCAASGKKLSMRWSSRGKGVA